MIFIFNKKNLPFGLNKPALFAGSKSYSFLDVMEIKFIFYKAVTAMLLCKFCLMSFLEIYNCFQVSFSTWEEGTDEPCQDYLVCVDPSSAVMRNPFAEKKWRKFQISRLFSSSNAAIKLHVVDVNQLQGGTRFVDKWLVALSLGSGQTRNMALDRYVGSKKLF